MAERLVLAVKLARKREETAGISPVVWGVASVCTGLRGQCGGGYFRQRAILTFPTSLMRKGMYFTPVCCYIDGASLPDRTPQFARRRACWYTSLPPVPYARLPYLGRGSGRQNARTDIPPRRPYNDGASLTAMRRSAVLVRVLAARSRPVIPLGRERTARTRTQTSTLAQGVAACAPACT